MVRALKRAAVGMSPEPIFLGQGAEAYHGLVEQIVLLFFLQSAWGWFTKSFLASLPWVGVEQMLGVRTVLGHYIR